MRNEDREAGLEYVIRGSQVLLALIIVAGTGALLADFSWTALVGFVVAAALVGSGIRGLSTAVARRRDS
jgi:hypothetical protein